MFFEIERDIFWEGLSKTVPIAEKRSPLPILSHILMETTESGLTVMATDLEVGLKINLSCAVKTSGLIALPARKIFEIVRELPCGMIILESKEGQRIRILCGESSFELAGMDAADYPAWSSLGEIPNFSVQAVKLLTMIDRTIFAASTDDSRFNLNGVLFEQDGTRIRMVSTDGHRLALSEDEMSISLDGKVIVPKKGLIEMKRVLESIKDDVSVGFDSKNVWLSTDKLVMSARLADGDYPEYDKVIPVGSNKMVKLNRLRFLQSLRRAAVLTSDRNKGVDIEIGDGEMVIRVNHPDLGSARDVMNVEYAGEKFLCIINVFYLIEGLGVLDSENIVFEFDEEGSPIIMRPDPPGNYFNLVMPMRK